MGSWQTDTSGTIPQVSFAVKPRAKLVSTRRNIVYILAVLSWQLGCRLGYGSLRHNCHVSTPKV